MNNIHEDDWADDTWSRHSGMFVRDTSKNPEENEPQNENMESDTADSRDQKF